MGDVDDDDGSGSYIAFVGLPTFLSICCLTTCVACSLAAALAAGGGQDTGTAARVGGAACVLGCVAALCFAAFARGPSRALQKRLVLG